MRRISDLPARGGSRFYQLLQTVLIAEGSNPAKSRRGRASYRAESPPFWVAPLSDLGQPRAARILLLVLSRIGSGVVLGPTESHETVRNCCRLLARSSAGR